MNPVNPGPRMPQFTRLRRACPPSVTKAGTPFGGSVQFTPTADQAAATAAYWVELLPYKSFAAFSVAVRALACWA